MTITKILKCIALFYIGDPAVKQEGYEKTLQGFLCRRKKKLREQFSECMQTWNANGSKVELGSFFGHDN